MENTNIINLPTLVLIDKIVLPNNDFKHDCILDKDQKSVDMAMEQDRLMCILLSGTKSTVEEYGLIARVSYKMEHGTIYKVKFNVEARCQIVKFHDMTTYNTCDCIRISSYSDNTELDNALRTKICTYLETEATEVFGSNAEDRTFYSKLKLINDNDVFCDLMANSKLISFERGMEYIKNASLTVRLKNLFVDLNSCHAFNTYDREIDEKVRDNVNESQKKYYLSEKRKAISEELGDGDSIDELHEMKDKIENSAMPNNIKEIALKEIKKLMVMAPASAEAGVCRNYLDFIMSLPFTETKDSNDLKEAKRILDEDHYGLEKVKERILEYIAVKMMSGVTPQSIICLVGPPGVGKTSVARSIARAMNKNFVKQSLGGVKDESEIRGHRRTYVGALPGRILSGIVKAKSINPVFLLDEIDKLSSDYKGDPSSALLEVLDSEQNKMFQDHYLDTEFDLGSVFFITTANYLENIPAPLRDRMEIIEMSSYTVFEKLEIAKLHLVPKQVALHGLDPKLFSLSDDAILRIINKYTREAGVRELERIIGSLVRKTMKKIMLEEVKEGIINKDNIEKYLGKPKFITNHLEQSDKVGIVNGLAYTEAGGDTLQIEATCYKGEGKLILTGSLGDVMKESAETALSFVKSHCNEFGLDLEKVEESDLHLHFPEGAVPKDGPSAGVAIATAIVSALSNRTVNHTVGMTGEITLMGKVIPIGGLREKSIAAMRDGLKTIYIPKENEIDLDEVPESVKEALNICFATSAIDVINSTLN